MYTQVHCTLYNVNSGLINSWADQLGGGRLSSFWRSSAKFQSSVVDISWKSWVVRIRLELGYIPLLWYVMYVSLLYIYIYIYIYIHIYNIYIYIYIIFINLNILSSL